MVRERSRPGAATDPPSGRGGSGLAAAFVIVAAILILSKVPTLAFERREADENIYWRLAESLVRHGTYSLRGTDILPVLPPAMYDRPLFHHPPLYAALLIPFVLLESQRWAIVVSWLGHLLCVAAIVLTAGTVARRRGSGIAGFGSAFWIPVIGVALDPLLTFVSRKMWIDGILAGLTALAAALFVIAGHTVGRRAALLASGILLGLAALAKLPALLLLPVLLGAAYLREGRTRQFVESVLLLAGPVVLLTAPWFVTFYLKCGVLVPTWVKADSALIAASPFVREFVERPWFYYALKVAVLAPLAPVVLWQWARTPSLRREPTAVVAALWLVVFLAGITAVSATGVGFLMRHVAPMMPAAYVLAIPLLAGEGDLPSRRIAYASCIAIGGFNGAMYLLGPGYDEIFTIFELVR